MKLPLVSITFMAPTVDEEIPLKLTRVSGSGEDRTLLHTQTPICIADDSTDLTSAECATISRLPREGALLARK